MTPLSPLYIANGIPVTVRDFSDALETLGVRTGDIIFVHSDVMVFGRLPPAAGSQELLQELIRLLLQALKPSGQLLMPTFTYSFCKELPFDPETSKSTVGILTEAFRKHPGSRRSLHPLFSVAHNGPGSDYFLDIGKDSFGRGTVFEKLRERAGKILFFGAGFKSCTFVHHAEQCYGIPYRYMKQFTGLMRVGNREYTDTFDYFVRRLEWNSLPDFTSLERKLREAGKLCEVPVGNGFLSAVDATDVYSAVHDLLSKDLYCLLLEAPPASVIEIMKASTR